MVDDGIAARALTENGDGVTVTTKRADSLFHPANRQSLVLAVIL